SHVIPRFDVDGVAALAYSAAHKVERACGLVGKIRTSIKGIAAAGSRFARGIAGVNVPGIAEACHASWRLTTAGVGHCEAHGLVRVVPDVHRRSGKRDSGSAEISSMEPIVIPCHLQHVDGAPARSQIVTGARAK